MRFSFFKRLRENRNGSALVYVAVLLPIAFGFLALGLDVAAWHLDKRQTQIMADAAALAAAFADTGEDDVLSDAAAAAALTAATVNGYDPDDGYTLTINKPPTMGDTLGQGDAIEVLISTEAPAYLSLFVTDGGGIISSRAVAMPGTLGEPSGACILTLEEELPSAFKISGTALLSLDCGIAVKSTDEKAFELSGTATIDSTKICVEGETLVGGDITFLSAEPENYCATPDDPLAGLEPPDADTCTCDENNYKISNNGGNHSLAPGVYCNGIEISGNSNDVTFEPGEFILAGQGLKTAGGDNFIHGDGVIFYNTDQCGNEDYGDIDFSGNNEIDFAAAKDGDYAGLLFFNDPSQESSDFGVKFKKAGQVGSKLDGAIYVPNGLVQFSGTVNDETSCGVKIISKFLDLNGTVNIFSPTVEECASNEILIGEDDGEAKLVE